MGEGGVTARLAEHASTALAAGTDDAMSEVNAVIRDAFDQIIGLSIVLALVFVLSQVVIRVVPRPLKPLAQLGGIAVMGVTALVLLT
jgi:hypothetical protein